MTGLEQADRKALHPLCVLKSRWVSPPNSSIVNWQCLAVARHRSHCDRPLSATLPTATASQIWFGPVRLERSVFASSTETSRNSLIVFDFFRHRRHHCHHRFGRRFGVTGTVESAAEKCLQIFALQPIENGVRASVNP